MEVDEPHGSTVMMGEPTEQTSLLLAMPHEVWAGIVWNLDVPSVGPAAASCRLFALEASDAELWFHLFMRSCWPPSSALLAFGEEATDHPAAVDWRARLRDRAAASPSIVVDVGRGYTKYTLVDGLRGRLHGDDCSPQLVQLCSSPTHPPDCDHGEQLRFISAQVNCTLEMAAADPGHRLHRAALAPEKQLAPEGKALIGGLEQRPDLNGRVVRLQRFDASKSRWHIKHSAAMESVGDLLLKPENLTPVREARDLPMQIGEPFAVTASRRSNSESGGSWDESIKRQLASCGYKGSVHIVSQAQMSLWAHGINHGVVVNIGQGQTIAVPVVNGEAISSCAACNDLGSGDMTWALVRLLGMKYPFIDSHLTTWCRDLKEQHCYVAPPQQRPLGTRGESLRARLATSAETVRCLNLTVPPLGGMRFRGGTPEGLEITLAEERVLVPEILFETQGRVALPALIAQSVLSVLREKICDEEGVRKLLRQVVLVGGAADFPGIRPRTEFEVRNVLQLETRFADLRALLKSPDDVFVLNPPLGETGPLTSPRFVPLMGGCVRAAGSRGHGAMTGVGCGAEAAATALPHGMRLVAVPGIASWVRRRRLDLNGPVIFRTGGGGGEDDQVWRMLYSDTDEEPEGSQDSESDENGAWDAEMAVDFPVDPTGQESQDSESPPGAPPERSPQAGAPSSSPSARRRRRRRRAASGREPSSASPASPGARAQDQSRGSSKGGQKGKGRTKGGQSKGGYKGVAQGHTKGSSKGGGKGRGSKGRGAGKGESASS